MLNLSANVCVGGFKLWVGVDIADLSASAGPDYI
jgi:hypothetical protein